jgi:hypothetical protein
MGPIPYPVTDGLTALWDTSQYSVSEGQSVVSVLDLSGNGNNLGVTNAGPIYTGGNISTNGGVLGGVDPLGSLTNVKTEEFTIIISVVSLSGISSTYRYFGFDRGEVDFQIQFASDGTVRFNNGSQSFSDNGVGSGVYALRSNGDNTYDIFVDGVLDVSNSFPAGDVSDDIQIGSPSTTTVFNLSAVHNTALTDTQIEDIYDYAATL